MTWKQRRQERIDRGLCPRCPNPLTKGKLCELCKVEARVQMRSSTGCKAKTLNGPGRPQNG